MQRALAGARLGNHELLALSIPGTLLAPPWVWAPHVAEESRRVCSPGGSRGARPCAEVTVLHLTHPGQPASPS